MGQDPASAVRSLRRQPGFTLVAVLTLATTIGLTTSVVTAFNAVLIKPWPVRDPAGVVTIADTATRSDFSIPQYPAGSGRRSGSRITAWA